MMNDQPAPVNPAATGTMNQPAAPVNPPVAQAPTPVNPIGQSPIQSGSIPVQPSPIASTPPNQEVPKKKKSFLKILLSLFLVGIGLVVVAAVVGYLVLLKPVSSKKICDNAMSLLEKEMAAVQKQMKEELGVDISEDEMVEMMNEELGEGLTKEKCIEDRDEWLKKVKKSEYWGLGTIAQSTKCQANAKTLEEFSKCEDADYIRNEWKKTSSSTEETTEVESVETEENIEAPVEPTVAAVSSASEITFEKTINVNDVVEFMFQIQDETQSYEGKGSMKVTELSQSDEFASSGEMYFYAIYEFKGDVLNFSESTARPSNMQDISAPHVVLLKEDTLPSIGGTYGGAYDSDLADLKGLEYKYSVKLNNPDWIKMGNTWSKKDHPESFAAIQYHDLEGNKKYIKVNF